MKLKKGLLFIILSLLSLSVFAHGKGDIDEKDVENINSWQEEFDLEGKTKNKAVKYNIMITATDLGGNEFVEGPFNIYVDPDSDIPTPGITNPIGGMRVVGNLNIVGTAVDDDGVAKVELLLDKGTENERTVVADGTEFWSYYLDTTTLEEGPHTIEVITTDINGTIGPKDPNKAPVKVEWQLDRRQPLTTLNELKDKTQTIVVGEDESMKMGLLVSGNVNFKGVVTDGNGIKELSYAIGNKNGTYYPVSLSKKNEFSFSVDTRKYADGPSVIWFKAVDKATSEGIYSFLYFIDNTKPDVKIVYPSDDDVVNGKFTVAGYAKDTIGITNLSWNFGDQSGEFDLIPGNPYWAVTVDTIGAVKEKSRKFTIHARDKAGNDVDVSKNISLNQEDDKPVVTISEPAADKIYNGDDEEIFVRGIVTDDDSVKSVKVVLDNGEEIIQETKGTFYVSLGKASDLSVGNHKITVTGIDENDVAGNPSVVQIVSKGKVPSFENSTLVAGKDSAEYVPGAEINPEAGNVYEITAVSELGLKEVSTVISWDNASEVIEKSSGTLKNLGSYKVSIPVTPDFPKGVVTVTVTATDSIDRVSVNKTQLYIKDTSTIKADEIKVIFDDSTVAEDGSIVLNGDYPVTGYVLGGNIVEAKVVPETEFIKKVEIHGNQIKLIPNMSAIGGTLTPCKVVVKTDKGKTQESRDLFFKNDAEIPSLKINNYSETRAVYALKANTSYDEETETETTTYEPIPVEISGSVTCKTGVGKMYYKVHGVTSPADPKTGVISKVTGVTSSEESEIKVNADGTFGISIDTANFESGMYLVEIIAESAGGNKAAKVVGINTIKPIPAGPKSTPKAKPAITTFIDSLDVYAVNTYQTNDGEENPVEEDFKVFPRAEMVEGTNALVYGKSKYTAKKDPTLKANFVMIDDQPYYSGMPVTLAYGPAKTGSKAVVYIETGAVVSSVSYEITGDEVAGGDQKQSGTIKMGKPSADNPQLYIAEIPLINLPNRINKITVKIKAGTLETEIFGHIAVVREDIKERKNDAEKIYHFPAVDTNFDKEKNTWVLKDGSAYYFYGNFSSPVRAKVECKTPGLMVEMLEGSKLAVLTALKDGTFENVSIKFTDGYGDVYETDKFNVLADSNGPNLNIETPELHKWLDNTLVISGTAQDDLGIRSVEYSIDKGETWKAFALTGDSNNIAVTYSETVDIKNFEDGLISIDVRSTDNAGHVVYKRTAAFKDVTPPEVSVIEPLEGDVVNGQNLVVFKVKDNGWFNKVEYVRGEIRNNIEIEPLVHTVVGTVEQPIEMDMTFLFTDDAGNTQTYSGWQFLIDNESDLPVAEIHVPEENQVLTPQSSDQFTISGVIYDDDGESKIFYKIDDGNFIEIPEMGTSFSIDVPFGNITDNEHSVTVYAVDLNGVKGNESTRNFRISLEEPKGSVVTPTIDVSVRDVVEIKGVASDKNGIEKVEISLDNGNTYNDAVGGENWIYEVDSRAIPGGTSAIFMRITDKYGIKALYSSLVNIDNQAPKISLDLPVDDSISTGNIFFSGYAFDNVEISKMYATIRNLNEPSRPIIRDLKINDIIAETMDISDLPDGLYNIEVSGEDMAGNKTNISRNIHLEKNKPSAVVDVLYPLNGEHKNGKFNIYGQAETNQNLNIEKLILFIDEKPVKETVMSDSGFYKFEINPPTSVATDEIDENGKTIYKVVADLNNGEHTYRVDAVLSNGQQVPSRTQRITYNAYGPWVTIDTLGTAEFVYGDFAMRRPYLKGLAGYSLDPEEVAFVKSKEAEKVHKDILAAKTIAYVEVSFDNGKTFELLSNKNNWQYRIENEDMSEGAHFIMIRATMKNGETAIERCIIQIDNTAPTINLVSPEHGGRYNQKLIASGLSKDDVGLDKVTVSLRKGDKSSYEVPSFIQGLYLDAHILGATLYDIGFGLTFFDDNVKLQAQFGQFTQEQRDFMSMLRGQESTEMRYGGDMVLGAKLLANIANIPFSFFLGRDWAWLSANFAVGAQFTRFNQTNSGKAQILSAVLAQLEFPRIHLSELKMFRTTSFYSEFSLWFIPSDVSGDDISNFVPQFGFGIRTNIF